MNESNISDSYGQNISEYKKIFDVSVLNSENETQYYPSSASLDHVNSVKKGNAKFQNKKGIYNPSRKNSTEQWNKNISKAINKINQIVDKDDNFMNNNGFLLDFNPLKRQNKNSFDLKDPYLDGKGAFPTNGAEINTTENKKERRKEKHEKLPFESKKKNKKVKESKKRSKKNKELKKKDETEIKVKHKRNSKNKDEILENLKSINAKEIKYDADISLNSSLNGSECSINKIIQKNLSEYSKDITDLINKDKEKELNNLNSGSQKKQTQSTTKPLILNDLNSALKDLIDQSISNNNNSITSETNNPELNNKILYIDNLIKEFKDNEEKNQSNKLKTLDNTNSRNIPSVEKNKNSDGSEDISIEIKCPFYSNGCTWCNKQSKLSDHLLYECTYCPNIITNAFAGNSNKKTHSEQEDKKKHIEELSQKLNKLTLNLNNDDKLILKKKNKSSEFDKDVLNFIFNNYLNEENDFKSERESSTKEKQDGLFDQIIQDYKYNNDKNSPFKEEFRHNKDNKLMLNTNLRYVNENPIATADINFNNEPLTWDINSEKDNQVPWSESPVSGKIKERKKYRLSDSNNEVKIKNKKSPITEYYAGKKLLKKYDNLISYYDYHNKNDVFNNGYDAGATKDKKHSISPTQTPDKAFSPMKTFKFNLPNSSKPLSISNSASERKNILAKPDPNIAKDLDDITLSINTQLLNKNKNISSMFTPQEIEVLMDVWFKKENDLPSENSLIFTEGETSFIKNLLSTFDKTTKNNIKEYSKLKLRDSCQNINLLGSIENLLELRQNEEAKLKKENPSPNLFILRQKEETKLKKENPSSNTQKSNVNLNNKYAFDFNYRRWNKNKDNIPQITHELNKAFNKKSEVTTTKYESNNNINNKTMDKLDTRKNKFKYTILCWIAKLLKNHTIFNICWKFINFIYNLIKYIQKRLLEKAIESSKKLDNKCKILYDEKEKDHEKKINVKKENISNYINNALSKYDSNDNLLLLQWSPEKKYQKEGKIQMKKKKFNKNQAQYYRVNKHNAKHNKDKHTFYTNFLDYQSVRGFKSLNIQNNIRKKIKMMQIIKDIKEVKTTSIVSPINKNKKRKVEMEKKPKFSVASYFNNTLNYVINSLMNNSKSKGIVADESIVKKQVHLFGAEANIDFNKHTLIIYNRKTSELNYIPKNKDNIIKKAVRLNEVDQLIIFNNDESGWTNILTSKAISNNMDLFYYEIKVGMSNPSKKCLYSWSIGFSTSKVQLNRYPDRLYSWDYYNTGSINKNNSLEKYGETFTQNDVIGCGIDFKNNLAFFTKNGKFMGVAVKNFLTEDLELYPNIGLFNYAKVETNFGAKEFIFNIKSYFYNKIH
ncbi:hypothetical protein BCR36DRAFT_404725 [Piromyces finnis]|uniref:B30.2/SPRY domain-containing protein n=1 Tax=Piromyces finnis TaxID=1754191 RepID=A0A1Y1V8H9_9FUNG|nr:hypothetical protein BCR36DRAFT_404725 [Piromyces finnis]|eukprot:ORX49758.1 hypothetical protein BCR36DRAFT_404725 [Piromyces finnis]